MIYPKIILVLMVAGGSPESGLTQIEMPSMEVCQREAKNFLSETALMTFGTSAAAPRAICVTTGETRQ